MNNKKGKIITLIIIVLLVLIVFGLIYFKNNSNNTKENDNNNLTKVKKDETKDEEETKEEDTVVYDKNRDFFMYVEDVFVISGKGTVVTGTVQRGKVNSGDQIQIVGINEEKLTATVSEMEIKRQTVDVAEAGTYVGIILKDIPRENVERGQVLAKPDTVKVSKKIKADITMFSEKDGGKKVKISNIYINTFRFTKADFDGFITTDGISELNPGEQVSVDIEFDKLVPMNIGTEFNIMKSGEKVGLGIVTYMYE